MQTARANAFWIKLVTQCAAIAFALSLLIATVGAAAGAGSESEVAPQAPQAAASAQAPAQSEAQPDTTQKPGAPQTYEGMITDTHCGAKHKASISESASDCVRICVHGGSKFALVDGEKTYTLEGDPAILKPLAGQRARLNGALNGTTITVSSVAPDPKPAE